MHTQNVLQESEKKIINKINTPKQRHQISHLVFKMRPLSTKTLESKDFDLKSRECKRKKKMKEVFLCMYIITPTFPAAYITLRSASSINADRQIASSLTNVEHDKSRTEHGKTTKRHQRAKRTYTLLIQMDFKFIISAKKSSSIRE